MTKEEHDALFQVWGALFNDEGSYSPYASLGVDKWANRQLIRNMDGMLHPLYVEHNAIVLGIPQDVKFVKAGADAGIERAVLAWSRVPERFKALAT